MQEKVGGDEMVKEMGQQRIRWVISVDMQVPEDDGRLRPRHESRSVTIEGNNEQEMRGHLVVAGSCPIVGECQPGSCSREQRGWHTTSGAQVQEE